tara:strand:+ start:2009 stop:3085 length:1077 start_codon:yes stop_codon:yes gene_type:complete
VPKPLDLSRLKVLPLAERDSMAAIDEVLIDPTSPPTDCTSAQRAQIAQCAANLRAARDRGAGVLLIYGAHLVKNGAHKILDRLMAGGWLTHLATNGAGVIHDWEWAHHGRSTESVRANVATGTFGAWDETGRNIHLALLAGAPRGDGFGQSIGRFIEEDGVTISDPATLEANPTPANAELFATMRAHDLATGRHEVTHPWKQTSILASAFRHGVPLTIHPGIGYDIISNHPMFNGAVLGRAADLDYRLFGGAVETLDQGAVLSVGSAIMGPQVFEKSLSCVNNLRLQDGREIVQNHTIHVIDIQDGGNWDWTQGEPPKDSPAYYLRFCKSYARMGGTMHYHQCDNTTFLHHLLNELEN